MGEDPNPQDNTPDQQPTGPIVAHEEKPSEFGAEVTSVESESEVPDLGHTSDNATPGADAPAPESETGPVSSMASGDAIDQVGASAGSGQFYSESAAEGAATSTPASGDSVTATGSVADAVDGAVTPGAAGDFNDNREPLAASHLTPAEDSKAPQVSKPLDRRKLIIIAAVAGLLLLLTLLFFVFKPGGSEDSAAADAPEQDVQVQRIGITPTIIDGKAWVLTDKSSDWQELGLESDLKEGYEVRTDAGSRAVLAFDDGSVLRLDENSSAVLDSLASNDVRVKHISGAAYSRVVASDRKYTVVASDVEYRAMGTAFTTVAKTGESGVLVYQSSVKAGSTTVGEGKKYYKKNANAELVGKVSDLDIDRLTADEFLSWCVSEDEKDAKFKDKLGVLADVKRRTAEIAEEKRLEAERIEAERLAREAAEKERLEAERKARESAAKIVVKYSDGGIFWEYAGEAKDGFKVLFSTLNQDPIFQQSGTSAIYVSEPRARYTNMPTECKKGKTCYIRVCAYRPQDSQQPCVDYSNVLTYKAKLAFRGRM